MDNTEVFELLLHGNQLKRTTRTGWAQRGVPDPENVASHSYGVAFTSLILANLVSEELDIGKLLSIAILHDVPEGLTSDIPVPSWRFMPGGSKAAAEGAAINEIFGKSGEQESFLDLWNEWQEGLSNEAKIVQDADKLDRYLQAYIYELHTGNRQLSEFWAEPERFNFAQSDLIYNEIRSARQQI
jgi:putative hydrolase of HD superfamily